MMTYDGNLCSESSIYEPKHGVPHKRPYQPADGARGCGREPEHDERVQIEGADPQGFDVLLAQDRDAARGGAQRRAEAGGQVVVTPRAPQLQVFVPGQGARVELWSVYLHGRARGEAGDGWGCCCCRCCCRRGSGGG